MTVTATATALEPTFHHEGRTYRVRVIGRCLDCGADLLNIPDAPFVCDCDEPPMEVSDGPR